LGRGLGGTQLAISELRERDAQTIGTMSLEAALVGTCCGVGLVGISAFLGVVLIFLFVTVVGAVADVVVGSAPDGLRSTPACAR